MKLKATLKRKELKQVTARDFGGGLNYVDSEFNLASKYAVAGYNMVSDDNGSLSVRWGTRLFANFATVLSARIIGIEYYFTYIIAVDEDGNVAAVKADGSVQLVWSAAIAATLSGSPGGWGPTPRANFGHFLGSLIIVNGEDKPIIIDNTLMTQYLQDLGSGSNINTPIAKYITNHSNYMVMAGDPNNPGRLYISNAGTSGTWTGDAFPNDAVTFDGDKYAPDSIGEITGITTFRDRLIVFFSEYIVAMKLGTYSTATPPVHTPIVDDIVQSYGAVGHRSIVNTGSQLLFLDYTGVSTLKQATFTNALTPDRASTLIDTVMQKALNALPRATLQDRAFAIYDKREARVLFFIPTTTDTSSTQPMKVFAYCMHGKTAFAWAEFVDWNFQSATVSVEGRVFFGYGLTVARQGNRNEPILSDYEGYGTYDGTAADRNSVWVYGSYCDSASLGKGIRFYHELPQNALQDRTVWKNLAYLTTDTQGASKFTIGLYLDDLKKRVIATGQPWSDGTLWSDGYGWLYSIDISNADSVMEFTGGDRGADGAVVAATPTTDFRPTDNMGLYAMYGHFKFFKLALSGTSYSHLRIVSISMYYNTGSIY